jgi:hypothetical protein
VDTIQARRVSVQVNTSACALSLEAKPPPRIRIGSKACSWPDAFALVWFHLEQELRRVAVPVCRRRIVGGLIIEYCLPHTANLYRPAGARRSVRPNRHRLRHG